MARRIILAFLVGCAPPAYALAAPRVERVDIRAEPLLDGLRELALQSGVELLFDRDLVGGIMSPAVRGNLTPEAAVQGLLANTGLIVRRARSGALIVERPITPPLAQQDVTVPELLIVGRRSQDSDIRRLEDDVQPYRVVTGEQVLDAHRDNIDQYFASRVTPNAQAVSPRLQNNGETNSEINLRGLGPDGTLVLLDGRRMPGIPAGVFGFRQPDLNPIPLHAIARVETLTGTAGGIYGFGALGGVVNVVLDRDRRGLDLHVTTGMSSRGDAGRVSLEGSFGVSSHDGRTDLVLNFGYATAQPLLERQRGYLNRDLALTAKASPDLFNSLIPSGNSIAVFGLDQLVFKPGLGGGALNADHTFLPIGFAGGPTNLVAALVAHAGQFESTVSDGAAASDIGSTPTSGSLLLNVQHRFDSGVEAYLDAVTLWNHGRRNEEGRAQVTVLSGADPANPFNQDVLLALPDPAARSVKETDFDSGRYTAGLIAPLPSGWRAAAAASLGFAHYQTLSQSVRTNLPIPLGALNPFGSWTTFQDGLAGSRTASSTRFGIQNHYAEQSLRLAGPVFGEDPARAALTLLAEHRTEDVPAYSIQSDNPSPVGLGVTTTPVAGRSSGTTSFYAELKSHVFSAASSAPLRSIETQIAVRHDRQAVGFSSAPKQTPAGDRLHATFLSTAYTVGAKSSPLSWLMLRVSYATGGQPPPLAALIEAVDANALALVFDPKRGGFSAVGGNNTLLLESGGLSTLKVIRASTLSLGGAITPFGQDGVRITLDYSHIRKTGDVLLLTADQVLANEDGWPERVTRRPLTDADRARGFTGGALSFIDARAANLGSTDVEAIDARVEWPLKLAGGRLRLYGDATYHMRSLQTGPSVADVETAGSRDGPLKWRANVGADWTRGDLTVGANLQYFGRFRVYPVSEADYLDELFRDAQGSSYVPSEIYLDAFVRKHLAPSGHGPARNLTVELGVLNLLDTAPPRQGAYAVADNPGYSRYGDPRRRRFELTLSGRF